MDCDESDYLFGLKAQYERNICDKSLNFQFLGLQEPYFIKSAEFNA
jgi:hypothetical protein